jgi:hypothetical protein
MICRRVLVSTTGKRKIEKKKKNQHEATMCLNSTRVLMVYSPKNSAVYQFFICVGTILKKKN